MEENTGLRMVQEKLRQKTEKMICVKDVYTAAEGD